MIYNNKRQKQGFSLVELLVVIAIILVLVALLLPMTLRLEDSANVMIDINNFRSIYQAMYSYAEENRGHIPHHQATKELGYYACWNAWAFWQARLGLDPADRNRLVGCEGHSSAGYRAVIRAYDQYVGGKRFDVFHCHSPRAPYQSTSSDTNYSFRTSNSCGAHGTDGPPGGWIIGTHNPKAHIIIEFGFQARSWEKNWDADKRKGPFDLIYGDGFHIVRWRHMGNQFPRLRLDGSAESVIFKKEWSGSRAIGGGWYPGGGGE